VNPSPTSAPVPVLSGLSVLDLGGIGPVPFAGRVLADHGAEVTRIERPGALEARSHPGWFARGKTVVELDLKHPGGVEGALALAERADAVIEGFRPGVAERLGLGPPECASLNPSLVYGRMTGWGQTGPFAGLGGHDINYIGLTGYLHQVGRAGTAPTPPLNIVGDFGGGGLMLAFGVVAALLDVARGGAGRLVDVAMVDGVSTLMAMYWTPGYELGPRGTNRFDSGAPFYDVYETADGRYMAVGATGADLWANLLLGLGIDRESLPSREDPANYPVIRDRLAEAFATRTRDEWEAVFSELDAAATPVLAPAEAPAHPHHVARGSFVTVDGHPEPAATPRITALG
jgi:alpha-methylacyl-CoA racemase